MTTASAPDTVVAQILAQAPDVDVADAMLLGSSFEGGWGPSFAVGDQGTSFGPFQMHEGGALTSSGLTPQQAEDPQLAVAAMLGSYEAGAAAQGNLWQTNPELAAEQAAAAAERPAQSYLSNYGQAALDSHWQSVQAAAAGQTPTGQATTTAYIPGTHVHIPGTGAGSSIVPGFSWTSLEKAGAWLMIVGAGVALMVAGAYKIANPGVSIRQSFAQAGQTAASIAPLAALA